MKSRGWGVFCVLLLIWGLQAPAAGQEASQDKRVTIEPKYLPVKPIEIADHPEQFVGRSVEVKDRYAERVPVRDWPRAVRQHGIQPETHVAFHTHRVTGSDMLCFLATEDQQSMDVLPTLVTESPITLVGQVLDRAGRETIFLVSRMWRGHVAPSTIEKRRLVITFKAPTEDAESLQYTIPELNKYYIVGVPTSSGERVKVHVKVELR